MHTRDNALYFTLYCTFCCEIECFYTVALIFAADITVINFGQLLAD